MNGYGEIEINDFSDTAYRDKEEAIKVLRDEAKKYLAEHKKTFKDDAALEIDANENEYTITISSSKRHYITYTAKKYYLK